MELSQVIGSLPYRMALAGGWIDQPFVSRHNPTPPGSMVVVSLVPEVRYMERSGMATGTRRVAEQLWGRALPSGKPLELVQALYEEENRGKSAPSGSQDMIGIVYPGVSRLDYDFHENGGVFPCNIESDREPGIARWLEEVLHVIPVAPRPDGYDPLEEQRLDPVWISRLGQSGADCYRAVVARDLAGLAGSMNECMRCWEAILPNTVRHRAVQVDLAGLLKSYQTRYPGAMYSGCGGGYLYVASEEPVPGSFRIRVRVD